MWRRDIHLIIPVNVVSTSMTTRDLCIRWTFGSGLLSLAYYNNLFSDICKARKMVIFFKCKTTHAVVDAMNFASYMYL
jgi:hypothetical protein